MPFTNINWLRDRLFTSIRRRRALAPLASTAIAMPSCFTLDSAIPSSSASDDGRSTAQGQGWAAGVGGFLSSFFSAGAARADGGKPSPDWDAHGLAASALPVPLSRLDGKKRYKVSELAFLGRLTRAAAEDPLFDALRPGGASILPGGTVSFEHRNICGLKRSLIGSVTSSNLLNPEDDLSFKLEYAHPYLDGVDNRSRNRTFKISCFNSRKLSPIFVAGPNMYEAPPIWVDRIGFKANITEWKRTCDDNNNICTHGSRQLPSGALSMIGPPTTFSGTGVDQMAFLQANITRDNTEFVNGAAIGDRCIFQMGQGLGIGSKNPFFNRHQLTMTKFINLNKQEKGPRKPPPAVLALHGRYAGCVGDLPSYDAFALGGPHSVRGYGMGELGASRNLLEVATELSLPVTVKNKHTHLRSMALTLGAPTIRVGHGSSYGVGVKLGAVRAEYAVDHNAGTGAFFLRFGSSVDLEVGAHPDVVAGQRVHPCKKERNKQ
uniref:Bacterial surface antigen (D15) domain-containing protein n=1 Tax=Oryza meridionalis TaxID=40149 RepID=A0A0E0F1W3_9ORYZ